MFIKYKASVFQYVCIFRISKLLLYVKKIIPVQIWIQSDFV